MNENRSCKYEGGMVCFYTSECTFPSLVVCLQQNLYLAQKEIFLLKEKRNLRHSKVSIKWRNNSFYYKKKLKFLEAWIKEKGMKPPKIEELFPQGSTVNLEPEITKDGGKDGSVRSGDTEGIRETRGDTLTSANGEPSSK